MEFGLRSPFFGAVCWPLQTGHRDAGEALDGTLSPHTHPPPRPAPGLPTDPQPQGPVGSGWQFGPPGLPAGLEHGCRWMWRLHLPAASALGVFGVGRWCGDLKVGELQTLPPQPLTLCSSLLFWGTWHSPTQRGCGCGPHSRCGAQPVSASLFCPFPVTWAEGSWWLFTCQWLCLCGAPSWDGDSHAGAVCLWNRRFAQARVCVCVCGGDMFS